MCQSMLNKIANTPINFIPHKTILPDASEPEADMIEDNQETTFQISEAVQAQQPEYSSDEKTKQATSVTKREVDGEDTDTEVKQPLLPKPTPAESDNDGDKPVIIALNGSDVKVRNGHVC